MSICPFSQSRWASVLMSLLFVFLLTNISADESAIEYLVDEDNWIEELELDSSDHQGNPVLINSATIKELKLIPDLTDYEIEIIIKERERKHITDIISLRRIGLTEEKANSILPYISFSPPSSLSFQQTHRVFQRFLDGKQTSRYYNKSELHSPQTQLGLVTLSDYGSSDLSRHYSYYFSHSTETTLRQLVLGKYRLALGQGIAYAPQTGFSKSSAATSQPIKNHAPLRPHSNPRKMWSLEGIAAIIEVESFQLIPFYSETKLDASLKDDQISTFYPYGTERKDFKNSVEERIAGLAVRYLRKRSSCGFYLSDNRFDRSFNDDVMPQRYKCFGMFINHRVSIFDIFGEYARIGDKEGKVCGIRWGNRKLQHLLLYRIYDKAIPHWHGNPFSSQAKFDNEKGVYYGLRFRPSAGWTINAFFDIWRHSDTRYFEKMPTSRTEQYLQVVYRRGKDTFRSKLHYKSYDRYRVLNEIPKIREEHKTVVSLDWTHRITSEFSKKSGIEYISRYIPEVKDFQKGILLFENIAFQYRNIRFTYQLNVFRADISHYIYEQSLDGMWENRPLNGDDLFSYLIIRADITKGIKMQGKFSNHFSGKTKSLITQIICRI